MRKNKIIFALGIIIIFAIAGGVLSIIFSRSIDLSETSKNVSIYQKTGATVQSGMTTVRVEGVAAFNPPSLESAPADVKNAVMLGHNILTYTRKYAGGYVGNKLTCSNCHFKGGRNPGREKRRLLACWSRGHLPYLQKETKLRGSPHYPDKRLFPKEYERQAPTCRQQEDDSHRHLLSVDIKGAPHIREHPLAGPETPEEQSQA